MGRDRVRMSRKFHLKKGLRTSEGGGFGTYEGIVDKKMS